MRVEFSIRFPISINPLTKLVHFVLVILYRNFLSFSLLSCIFARFSPRFSFPMSCIHNPVAPFLLVFLSILSILLCFPPLSAIALAPSSTSSKILAVLQRFTTKFKPVTILALFHPPLTLPQTRVAHPAGSLNDEINTIHGISQCVSWNHEIFKSITFLFAVSNWMTSNSLLFFFC